MYNIYILYLLYIYIHKFLAPIPKVSNKKKKHKINPGSLKVC